MTPNLQSPQSESINNIEKKYEGLGGPCIMNQILKEFCSNTPKVLLSTYDIQNCATVEKNLNNLFTVLDEKLKFSAQDSNLKYLFWQRRNLQSLPT